MEPVSSPFSPPGCRRSCQFRLPGGSLLLHHRGVDQEVPGSGGDQGSKTDSDCWRRWTWNQPGAFDTTLLTNRNCDKCCRLECCCLGTWAMDTAMEEVGTQTRIKVKATKNPMVTDTATRRRPVMDTAMVYTVTATRLTKHQVVTA